MKKRIFTIESKPFLFMETVGDIILLSLCWFITSLPIITIGASTAAIYTVFSKIINREGSHTVVSFFKAFAQNFKKATLCYIPFLTLVIISSVYLFTGFGQGDTATSGIWNIICVIIILFCIGMGSLALAQLAVYENSISAYLKNAMILFFVKPLYTLSNVLLLICPLLLFIKSPELFLRLMVFFPVMGIGIQFYFSTKLILECFKIFSSDEDNKPEDVELENIKSEDN